MDWKKALSRTTAYVFYGVAAVQMFFGVIWILCQFPHMQNWYDTYEYLDISRTLVLDEYVGFLYPLLLKLCTGAEAFAGIPFYMPVYVIQLAAAVFACLFFIRKVLKLSGGRAYMAAGYLMSFPLLLQFHMAVRPESLAVSGVLLLLGVLGNNGSSADGSSADGSAVNGSSADGNIADSNTANGNPVMTAVCGALLTMALIWLMPDLIFICIAVWILYLFRMLKKIKGFGAGFAAFILALVISLSVNALVQTPGSRGRIQKTFWAAAFERVVTDYFSRSYAMWDDEVRTTFTIEEAMELAKRSDNMMYIAGPMLEADWGKERANQLYRQMTLDCFRVRTKDVVYRIGDDLVDSLLTPFSVWWQDSGKRQSQTGWNYARFRESAPEVAQRYLFFGNIGLLGVIICKIFRTIMKREKTGALKCLAGLAWVAAIQCVMSVFFPGYSISIGNAVSYDKLLFVIVFWITSALLPGVGEREER